MRIRVTYHYLGLYLVFALLMQPSAEGLAADNELNIYNWADYIAPNTIADFEKEFGIKVNYDLYDNTVLVEAKLLAGRTGYDVVVHSSRYASRLIPIGVYQPLQREKLPLWKNLDPAILEVMQGYDPDNMFGLPYMWGSTGYTINVEMVKQRMPDAPLGSGAMLFDPEVVARFADCGVTFTDEAMDMIPMVLQFLGYDADSLDPGHLAEAEAQLKSVRPYIRYFSSTMMLNDLPNEEVCVAVSWSGDYAQAMNRAKEVGADVEMAYYTPVEGWIYWFDALFIPADAPNLENAYLFLNYLLRPEVMGAISNETHYANANLASVPHMDASIVNDPAVYPSPEVRKSGVVAHVFGPKEERGRIRAWSRIKTGL
jgi:putrescine transport system substrate-binding protein